MKKLIVIGIIAMMITGLSVAANAYAGTVLNIQAIYGPGTTAALQVGFYDEYMGAPSVDGWDNSDGATDLLPMDGTLMQYISPVSGNGPYVTNDFRTNNCSPYPTQTTTKAWRVWTWLPGNSEHVAPTYGMKAWFGEGFEPTGTEFYIFEGAPTVSTMRAAALAGTGFLAKLDASTLSYNSGTLTWSLPAPSSSLQEDDNGNMVVVWGPQPAAVQNFSIYAQSAPVPEPGSMLAMFSGLVGLVGFGIRRRK